MDQQSSQRMRQTRSPRDQGESTAERCSGLPIWGRAMSIFEHCRKILEKSIGYPRQGKLLRLPVPCRCHLRQERFVRHKFGHFVPQSSGWILRPMIEGKTGLPIANKIVKAAEV